MLLEFSKNSPRIITGGHSGFALRHTWLKKARDLGHEGFSKEDATIRLGVGKNMVQAIHYYAKLCDIFHGKQKTPEELHLTDIFDDSSRDPYLDYIETIWLIHYKLATNAELVSYYEFFNSYNETVFSNNRYKEFLHSKIEEKGSKMPAEETLKRDVACFIANYAVQTEEKPTDSFGALLRELKLIQITERSTYKRIYKKASDITEPIFLYVVANFWHSKYNDQKTLSLQAISQDPESPGRIFQMHEDEIYKKLEEISKNHSYIISKTETAGIVNIAIETSTAHLVEYAIEDFLAAYNGV